MATESLRELSRFLDPESRIDLKSITLDQLLGLTNNEEGIGIIIQNYEIIDKIIALIDDSNANIRKNALYLLVNLTASINGAKQFIKHKVNGDSVLRLLTGYVSNPHEKLANPICMILSNVTRLEDELEEIVDVMKPHMPKLLNCFTNITFNKHANLDYLAPTLNNLSRSPRIRLWLVKQQPHVPIIRIISFCNYELSVIRRGGAVGVLKNIALSHEYHTNLLNPRLDILTYILNPLMGNEDYPDEEMDQLPISLQYLPKEKQREVDLDIRKMLLEILNSLCSIRSSREYLRENGVYYILREYHKWETEPSLILACENVVDILIQKEEEIGVDDLTQVKVTPEMAEKFIKMDQDFVDNY